MKAFLAITLLSAASMAYSAPRSSLKTETAPTSGSETLASSSLGSSGGLSGSGPGNLAGSLGGAHEGGFGGASGSGFESSVGVGSSFPNFPASGSSSGSTFWSANAGVGGAGSFSGAHPGATAGSGLGTANSGFHDGASARPGAPGSSTVSGNTGSGRQTFGFSFGGLPGLEGDYFGTNNPSFYGFYGTPGGRFYSGSYPAGNAGLGSQGGFGESYGGYAGGPSYGGYFAGVNGYGNYGGSSGSFGRYGGGFGAPYGYTFDGPAGFHYNFPGSYGSNFGGRYTGRFPSGLSQVSRILGAGSARRSASGLSTSSGPSASTRSNQ
ncbi:hypothetical protein V5799_011853 [Amblyomma americanum]|uniref:Glycine-rich secreted cement protein n=1 Tax=Amblyomma americanum TaxID=6943 RepID=A0AAQ4EG20_AMBAM